MSGFCYSEPDGSYEISRLNPGEYRIEAVAVELDESYYGGTDEVSAQSVSVGDLASASNVDIVVTTSTTPINDSESSELPTSFDIDQNYPNPFNPNTEIAFELPATAHVTLRIYNLLGQEVRMMLNGIQEAGYRTIEWDGTNNFGVNVTSGIYIYHFTANSADGEQFHKTMKMTLLR